MEGYRAVIDLDDGSVGLPAEFENTGCSYEQSDCAGTCYGADKRYLGFVIHGIAGSLYSIDPKSTLSASFTTRSRFSPDTGTCSEETIQLSSAYQGEEYSGILATDLATPLYIDKSSE